MSEHVNVSRSAVTLASGRPLAPGESAPIDLKDPHDKALADDGLLMTAVESLPFEERHMDDLKTEAETRGLQVKGTGKDGAVVKADLVKALEADDQKETS